MQIVSSELAQFHRFVEGILGEGNVDISPEECLDQWRSLHPSDDELAASAAAVRAAIAESEAGLGRPAEQVLAELRAKYGAVAGRAIE